MEFLLPAAMLLVLLAFAALIFIGGRSLKAEPGELTGPWPKVAVLVPVTGAAAGLESRLKLLLRQDYPD